MNTEEMLESLRSSVCKVSFTKKDGENRVMLCTLQMDRIPEESKPKTDGNIKEDQSALTSLRVFDVTKQAWRSFIVDNVYNFSANQSL